MKRIQPAGCGYISGYICRGLSPIDSAFRSGSTAIPMPIVSGGTVYSDKSGIPQQLEGFVMTLSPVIDMDTLELEIPELECRTEFNPFEISEEPVYKNDGGDYTGLASNKYDGFLDFYLNGGTIGTPITTESKTYKESVYIKVDGATTPVYVPGSENPYILGGTWTFTDAQVVGPGILEPMVDTDFSPITIDTIPPSDAYFDTTTYLFDIFDAWRSLVDERLNNIHDYVIPIGEGGINGLLNLENAKNQNGGCYNFEIVVNGPQTQVIGGVSITVPTYNFAGPTDGTGSYAGIVKIDGEVHKVLNPNMGPEGGVPASVGEQGFDAYLDIFNYTDSDTTTPMLGATIAVVPFGDEPSSTSEEISGFTHRKFEYIGSVKKIISDAETPFEGNEAYKLYEIEQGDCIYEINLDGESGGGSLNKYYDGPFKVTCDAAGVHISNSSLSTDGKDIAGRVFVCGSSVATGDETTLANLNVPLGSDMDTASYDVYAIVTKGQTNSRPAWTVEYDTAPGKTGTYSIRLGHVDIIGQTDPALTIPSDPEVRIITTNRETGDTVKGEDIDGNTYSVYINDIKYYPGSDYVVQYINVTIEGETYSVNPEADRSYKYAQYHAGDLYLDDECSGTPIPPGTFSYNGPFALHKSDDGNTGYVECDICPSPISTINYAGYYSINGLGYAPMAKTDVTLTGETTYVFFNLSGSTGASIETTGCTSMDCYSVCLGAIVGATEGVEYIPELDENNEPVLDANDQPVYAATVTTYYGATDVWQYQYGNIHVDGRWS